MTEEEKREYNRVACRKWRAKNIERERERDRKRFAANPEREIERNRKWRDENPERSKELGRASYHRNKHKHTPHTKPVYLMWWNAKKRANAKNLPFNIEQIDIEIPEHCPVFGTKIEIGHPLNGPSLDKIIPEFGYVKGNCMVISRAANTIKSFGTAAEHRKIADYIAANS